MKKYEMKRGRLGGVIATVLESDGSTRPLPHLVRHSPDGFEWGYGGSGPSDLARSIVGDVVGSHDPAPRVYQAVKMALIASLPHEGGVLSEEQIREVIDATNKHTTPL